MMALMMVRSTAFKIMMKARERRRKPEEYRGVRRRIRNRLVDFRGARAYCCPLWTLGELADITFDRDDAARSCTTLHFHALPVHVRKGFFFIAISLRHPQQIEVSATSLLSKMAISLETSSESLNASNFALHEK